MKFTDYMYLNNLKKEIRSKYNKKRAEHSKRFFKTGKEEYGEGDIFYGLSVPEQRKIANLYWKLLSQKDIQKLLDSKIHEERMTALLILVKKFEESEEERENIFKFYIGNTKRINNWDLVDLSAPKICGEYLLKRDRKILYNLTNSDNLWERRIAIVSTHVFIKKNQFKDTLKISKSLLNDEHDLIQKAVGWMLREVGKRDLETEEIFLKRYYKKMPRTMLRYAIERFEEGKRIKYLRGEIN